ncbi:MAG: putative Ig domain-containing protein, partial [Candidatus Thermoplasmatota archaeon]|nr:putative Ig domain-containing protein [Candidatus Thermoplasmatota archaeon]
YTIWANNSGGSASAQVNITVNDEAPDITYNPDWFVLTNNTAMSPTATPTNSGGAIPSAVISSNGNPGYRTSIAIDSYGYKHISWHSNSGFLKYATDASGSWAATNIDTASGTGFHSSIAIDSNDGVHISYFDNANDDLKYATCSSGCTTASNWNKVSVDTSGDVGYYTSIAIDSDDAVHISYYDETNSDLKYSTCSSGCATASNWNKVSVETSGKVGYYTSIALDSNDAVHISHFDNTNNDLKYTTCSSSCTTVSNWNSVDVDSLGSSVYMMSSVRTGIAIDSNDGVHISYYHPNKDLKYATCSSGCTTASNWDDVSVDASSNVGYHASIGIDSNDAVHISYFEETKDVLKYATCSSGCSTVSNWNNETIDSIGQTGYHTSMAIDANDVIHISYFDDTNNKIKYLALDSSSNTLGYSISPDLPEGLTLNPISGEISGTPTELSTNTTYTITVRNSGGVNTTTITMLVNDQVPNALGYTLENMTLEKGTTMTTNTPSVSGGAVTSWQIDPSLPSGLSFGSTNGSIWGTPTILQTTTATYTIWANNSGGSESAQVNITINDQIASVSYPSTVEISNDRTMTTVTPTNTGGAVTSWAIVPSLPSGLNFGSSNGSIWGTPSGLLTNETYTVYANNSGGSTSITFTLGLNWTLTPSVEGAYITRNSSLPSDITWEWDYDPLEADNLSIATGDYNTCAIKDNGDVYCWGRNGNGQIGNGQTSQVNTGCGVSGHKCKDVPTLTHVKGSNNYDAVSLAFGDRHACALLDDGDVVCWGRNNAGQLGTSGGDKDTPQAINLGTGRTATSIYAGGNFNCAILDDASVKCWGHNNAGQLGIGSQVNTNTPTTINSLGSGRTAVTLALAHHSMCALLDDGSVKCWGANHQGQLGNGGSPSLLTSPPSSAIDLGTGRTAKAITGGETHFCAILDDNSIKCWGGGANGKLGTGSTSGQNTPTSTSGSFASGRYAVAIDAGYQHTCVILDNGDLTCWGSDSNGQLGNGATVTGTKSSLQSTTVDLGIGRTAISLSAGGQHTCAQLDNGELKCWGNRGSGQVGDNGGFGSSVSDRTSPVSVNGGHTYLDTGAFPSDAVSGATCSISPSLPTGLSLTAGTCAITGTPTVTATNATYTIWANISGQSFSGQIWLEVGLNAPDVSYSSSTYTYTKDSTISTLNPINVGGEVTTWAINTTLPSGLSFGTSNGSIWGTPDTVTAATSYTIWANNSAGSNSTIITFTVNDPAPNFYYGGASSGGFHPVVLYLNQTMNAIHPTMVSGSGLPTSCSSSPTLPSGITLSSTCVISGTPNATDNGVFYTITGTNTGGSDVGLIYLVIRSYGGALTISPTNREGSVNSALSNITMSYTHSISNYGWTSGVSNSTSTITNNYLSGSGTHLLGVDSGEQGEMVIVYPHNDTSSSSGTHSLGMMYFWNGTWTETILDNATDTGHYPSVAIDRQGAIHIAYTDYSTNPDVLRYATNASGTWVFTTLGYAASNSGIGRGTAIVVHPITNAVHIVATSYENSVRGLRH